MPSGSVNFPDMKPSDTSQKVYLLEYDNTLRDLMRISLSRSGFTVLAEKNADTLLSATRENLPDLFIIDLFIPGVDSLQFIGQIKEACDAQNIPLIVLSAYGFEEIIIQTISLGVADFILKPFDVDFLVEKVKKWIASRKE